MSKILGALNEVKEIRKDKYTMLMSNGQGVAPVAPAVSGVDFSGSEANGHAPAKWSGHLPLMVMLIVLGVLFTTINYRMVTEISKVRSTTSNLAVGMGNYETKLSQLQKGMNTLNVNYHDVKRDFNRQVEALQSDNQKILKEFDEMSIENNLLRVQLGELESTNQKLMDGYIGFNNEIKELRNSIAAIPVVNAQ